MGGFYNDHEHILATTGAPVLIATHTPPYLFFISVEIRDVIDADINELRTHIDQTSWDPDSIFVGARVKGKDTIKLYDGNHRYHVIKDRDDIQKVMCRVVELEPGK